MSRAIRITPQADRVLIVGQTGKGKTTLAEYIVGHLQPCRTIIFDAKEEWADGHFGYPAARTVEQLAAALHQPVVHFIPSSLEHDELEEACWLVWITPGPYIWLIDETSAFTNANYCPRGLKLGVTQGRKQRKLILALTQRLAESHPVFRSQAEHVIVLVPTPIELDLKAIASAIRRDPETIRRELESLHKESGDYSHLWYVLDGDELRRMAPAPLGGADNPPRVPQGTSAPEAAEPESPSHPELDDEEQ
jgi:energy-coupling factor transporter ATP-binding protein EcfA2